MLLNRVLSKGAKIIASDLVSGVYVSAEIEYDGLLDSSVTTSVIEGVTTLTDTEGNVIQPKQEAVEDDSNTDVRD